ncbi:hypothetical protein, partial [Ileibacterium valens]|uniref:hypothetical protein n=1 Tax=Ileibacterium valens TaxID=1862668 RepID=UPI00259B2928
MMTEQKKYRRLVDNLSSLGLKGMEINLDEYLEQIGNKEKSVIEALCELTDIEMKLKTDRAIVNANVKPTNNCSEKCAN